MKLFASKNTTVYKKEFGNLIKVTDVKAGSFLGNLKETVTIADPKFGFSPIKYAVLDYNVSRLVPLDSVLSQSPETQTQNQDTEQNQPAPSPTPKKSGFGIIEFGAIALFIYALVNDWNGYSSKYIG